MLLPVEKGRNPIYAEAGHSYDRHEKPQLLMLDTSTRKDTPGESGLWVEDQQARSSSQCMASICCVLAVLNLWSQPL